MIPLVSKRQIKAARALLGWTQEELATKARISAVSVKRIETRRAELYSSGFSTVRRILLAFEASGIEFEVEAQGGLVVRLQAQTN